MNIRSAAVLAAALFLGLGVPGCGGGGGGANAGGGSPPPAGNPPPQGPPPPVGNPSLATVSGQVTDNRPTPQPVAGARVAIAGTNLNAVTDANGQFTIVNVPLNSTAFTVTSPDTFAYYNFANYQGQQYDTIQCTLPLPAGLKAGADPLPATVQLYLGGSNPPPPPLVNGCPK